MRTKRHVFASGRERGGVAFSRGQVYALLRNPVYRGLIRHKDKLWPGAHPAIVDDDLWQRVQSGLQGRGGRQRGGRASAIDTDAAPLKGLIHDETGDALTPSHTPRRGRRFRYYISNRLVSGGQDPTAWRLPAPAMEQTVATLLADHLDTCAMRHAILDVPDVRGAGDISDRAAALASRLRKMGAPEAAPYLKRLALQSGSITIQLQSAALAKTLGVPETSLADDLEHFTAPFTCRRRGAETKIVAGKTQLRPDANLLRALRNAHDWAEAAKFGQPLVAIADRVGVTKRYVARIIPIAGLASRIQAAILEGRQPPELTLEALARKGVPLDWDDQARKFGFAA